MSEFSIEKSAENIHKSKTKEYFEEVLKCYYSESFRSATVMLFSVVICDLIFKLQDLRDKYSDVKAKKILDDIETIKNKRNKSPEWEMELVRMINENTSFFEGADYDNIINLQKQRHLSAHPVLNQIDLLYTPSKENVRANIQNMLAGVLTKPPILSKKITEELLLDISENKDIFIKGTSDLKKYLESKYFKNLSKDIENSLFRSLWKLVFKIENDECNANRRINYETLKIIYKRREAEIINFIESDKDYFSNIKRCAPLFFLVGFLSKNPKIFELLNDEAKELIRGGVRDSDDAYLISWFISDNFVDHLKSVREFFDNKIFEVRSSVFANLLEISSEFNCMQETYGLGIFIFGKSENFSCADKRFSDFIEPYINKYEKDNLLLLLTTIENHRQVYDRNRARFDNIKIKDACDWVLGGDFDYSKYPEFMLAYNLGVEYLKKREETKEPPALS